MEQDDREDKVTVKRGLTPRCSRRRAAKRSGAAERDRWVANLVNMENEHDITLPLSSALGLVSVVVAGLLFGYIFQRTENILAPWLAHAIGGIALVLIGEMSFVQYKP